MIDLYNKRCARRADVTCGAGRGRYGPTWLGVALADVTGLSPGAHELEMIFPGYPPLRRALEKLEIRNP